VQGSFVDSGTLAGSFNYGSGTYDKINVVTTPGTIRTAGATYTFVCGIPDTPPCGDGVSPLPASVVFLTTNDANQVGKPSLFMIFGQPLDTALFATTIAIGDNEGNCAAITCTTVTAATDRKIETGTAASTIPVFEFMYFGG
jgi:hypothetical protein